MAALLDHLWQSVLVVGLVWTLSRCVAANAGALRLWMWRIAAIKFLVPFSLLYTLGAWAGFPVRHSAIPPPAALQEFIATAVPWTGPMQAGSPTATTLWAAALLAASLIALCARTISHELGEASRAHMEERARAQAAAWQVPPPLSMLQATTLAAITLACLCAPLLAGAVHDRVRRQSALALDMATLRDATITVTESVWRFGDRPDIVADADGISIHKVNLRDLVAMVYGIDEFEVFGGALPWLESPHYHVRATGRVHSPRLFDPYSLRQPVTKYLQDEYGVSIRVNGDCQEPCLDQESFVIERIPWTLSKAITGQR